MSRRMFIAIDLPKDVCWRLSRLMADAPRGVRPVRPAQLHITLHFLGDLDGNRVEALREALGQVRHGPISFAVQGTGVFPPRGRPSVLWAGVAGPEAIGGLQTALGAAIEACGIAVEQRPYHPHITLARLTPAVPRQWTSRFLADTGGLASDPIAVERFQLYESRKLDGATEHTVEATFPLVE